MVNNLFIYRRSFFSDLDVCGSWIWGFLGVRKCFCSGAAFYGSLEPLGEEVGEGFQDPVYCVGDYSGGESYLRYL